MSVEHELLKNVNDKLYMPSTCLTTKSKIALLFFSLIRSNEMERKNKNETGSRNDHSPELHNKVISDSFH